MPASTSLFDLLLQTGGSRRHAGQAINLDTPAPSSADVSGASDSSATNARSFEGRSFAGATVEATTLEGAATNARGSAPFSTATADIHSFVTPAAPAAAPSADATQLTHAAPLSDAIATGLLSASDPLSQAATAFNTTDNADPTAPICQCRICQEGLLPGNQSGTLEGLIANAGTVAGGTLAAGSASSLASSVDLGRTFFLHSNPTATKTIYLDFNGHTTTGTRWNNKTNPALTTSAFDFDGNVNVFSNAELERIQFIWQRVAEDFAPFGINVTTQDLGADALANTGGRDNQWGVRAAIGGSFSDWYGSSAGGVAYVNTFGNAAYGPAFVFSKNLGNGNEKYTAEAISHEVGHTLGLLHDGTSSASYFGGQGTGTTGWASIMGSGYYKNVTQWSQGEYNGANNTQDDLARISGSSNGAGYRADDFGNSAATAKLLSGNSLNQFGIIETRTDSDWFRFSTGSGNVSLSINNATQAWINDGFGSYTNSLLAGRSPNLDIAATLYGADGTLIASSNPLDKLTASFNLNLNAGTYFLKVDGVGFGNPLSNGYSDYGSLGQYLLTGTLAATTANSATSATSELPAYQVMGDANANTLAATNNKDILTGGAGADTFSFASLSTSNLANYDRITDFAIGTDKLNAPTAVSAANLKELGAVSTFDLTGISTLLTATSFAANRAATFSFADTAGPRTFLALNDATAGFSATNDAIVEITGFTGSLTNLALV
jgi:hypothetical protein